jgi:ubiquinone/menaquinone biosynthesis C-methylase UbiE
MKHNKSAKDVFEAWGRDYHADGMETEHWPRVRQMFDLIEPSEGDYLEVGVGNGYGLAHMATHQFKNGRCLGLDLSTSMVERARERVSALPNVEVEAGDFLKRDFGGQRFETIFSMEVFYYFENINDGLQKAFSILNPGGGLWVAVNFYEENEVSADWPDRLGTPMQRWSKQQYSDGFARAGFADIEQKLISAPVPEGSEHGDSPTLLTFGTKSG